MKAIAWRPMCAFGNIVDGTERHLLPDLARCSISRRCKNSFCYRRVSGLPNLATPTAEPDPNLKLVALLTTDIGQDKYSTAGCCEEKSSHRAEKYGLHLALLAALAPADGCGREPFHHPATMLQLGQELGHAPLSIHGRKWADRVNGPDDHLIMAPSGLDRFRFCSSLVAL